MKNSNRKISIGVDLMGCDIAPSVLSDTLAHFASQLPAHVELISIGSVSPKPSSRLLYHPASEFIDMTDHPLEALKHKKKSSMIIGMRLLKKKQIDAFVSAGNTGALTTSAKWGLGTFHDLKRPALLALLPTRKNPVAVIDVGANINAKALHLKQFALLGAAFQRTRGVNTPRVGLLNIGQEKTKGTAELCLVYQKLSRLSDTTWSFAGNIEGTQVFSGDIDVLVCNGFTGNVLLKTAEGISQILLEKIRSHLPKSGIRSLEHVAKSLQITDPPGALLSGVNGIVMKCHGASSAESFLQAIQTSIELVSTFFLSSFQNEFFQLSSGLAR